MRRFLLKGLVCLALVSPVSAQDVPTDSVDLELINRIASIYELHVDAMRAQVTGDLVLAEQRILESVAGLQGILDEFPEAQQNRRVTELYRTVMIEYQMFYGITEPLRDTEGDVFAILDDMFAQEDEWLSAEGFVLPDLGETPATQVPLILNRQVQARLHYLTVQRRGVMERWLERSARYFPMMKRIFAEEGVPLELIHLSMIESGLVPVARSRARAVGLWQFMQATGSAYGLTVNYWIDERRDPEKSTRAAARHLKDLHRAWNQDWHVALAAYNVSPRRLNSAIRQAGGTRDYWAMYPYLPAETRGYVPTYIAATLVATNPEDFGFRPVEELPWEYDVVEIQGSIDLGVLARLASISTDSLRALNPELLRWATPPGPNPYPLKIPRGTKEAFETGYLAVRDHAVRNAAVHTVRRGESLGVIANKYGVTVRDLYAANESLRSVIHPGQEIVIPVPDGGTVAIQASEPSLARTAATADASARTEATWYTVRRGDSLWLIARRHGITVNRLKEWNNLNGNQVRPGQRLRVSAGGAS